MGERLGCLGASAVTSRPLDRGPVPWLAISATQPRAPTPHQVVQASITPCLQWKIREWEGRGKNENKGLTPLKNATLQHAEMSFEATMENAQRMC